VENAKRVVAIELVVAAQAAEFLRPLRSSAPLESLLEGIRAEVPALDRDRPGAPDLERVICLMNEKTLRDRVERTLRDGRGS
jgi:histidine ammonia-lyase